MENSGTNRFDRRGFLKAAGAGVLAISAPLGIAATPRKAKPNIVLVMVDDFGYECVGCNGSTEYKTPVLDRLAAEGVRFEQCHSQPLCTPSRVQIMTGRYNVRNYEGFGYLNPKEVTFANLLRSTGYATCIAGKWQLSGDAATVRDFGFDEHCLWNMHAYRKDATGRGLADPEGWLKRYAAPTLFQNGKWLADTEGKYGPDLCCDLICSFIERHRDEPFCVYYPMILTHDPFVPTPDSDGDAKDRKKNFADMVAYTDKIVGRIVTHLDKLGLRENTLVLFTGDNGTHFRITSRIADGAVQGGKGKTTDAGTRVPMIASWPGTAGKGKVCGDLVDFSDFLPTVCEVAGAAVPTKYGVDGRSFLPQIRGRAGNPREWIYCWYSRSGSAASAKEFARSRRYKLYRTGEFFDISRDVLERFPLAGADLDAEARKVRGMLGEALGKYTDARPASIKKPPRARTKPQPKAARKT